MFKLLSVPEINTEDYFYKARFAITWRICSMFVFLFGIISVLTFYTESSFFPHYLAVFGLNLFSLIHMYYSKRHKFAAIGISLISLFLIIISIVDVKNALHIIQILWMLVIVLFAFFTLSKIWGFFFLLMNCVIYVTYFNTQFFINIRDLSEMTQSMKSVMSVEFVVAMFLIGYILHQFYTVTSFAREQSQKALLALEKEKEVINVQNTEKTVLLQEIHHRVKNNLQVIISLLRIQSADLKSEEAKKSFHEAINRIMTMSLIHQKMYERETLATINLKDYINTLAKSIVESSATNGEVKLKLDIQLESVGSKTIVPLALLLNELISNSIKHAFDLEGQIVIVIQPEEEEGFFIFEYFDNGTWKDSSSNNFGLQLLDIFSEQLEGGFKRDISDQGTSYRFRLRNIDLS